MGHHARREGGPLSWRGRPHPELHRRGSGRRAPPLPAAVAVSADAQGQPRLPPAPGPPARAAGRQDRLHGGPPPRRARAVLRARPRSPHRVPAQGRLDRRRDPRCPPGHPGRAVRRRPGGDGQRRGQRGRRPPRQGGRLRRPGVRPGHRGGPGRPAHRLRHHRARAAAPPAGHDPADQPRHPGRLHPHPGSRHRLPSGPPARRDPLARPDAGEDRRDPPPGRSPQNGLCVTSCADRRRADRGHRRCPAAAAPPGRRRR